HHIRAVTVQAFDLPFRSEQTHLDEAKQPFGRLGHRTVAIAQFLPKVVELERIANAAQSPIYFKPLFLSRDVLAWQIRWPGHIDGDIERGLAWSQVLERTDLILQ